MDINGKQVVKGAGPSILSLVGDSASGGQQGQEKKWVLTFPNGIKIQSDTVIVTANSTEAFALPEAYTDAHYTVLVSCADEVGTGVNDHCLHGEPQTGNLTHVIIENIGEDNRHFMYLSIGRDV